MRSRTKATWEENRDHIRNREENMSHIRKGVENRGHKRDEVRTGTTLGKGKDKGKVRNGKYTTRKSGW
jgi:hypothetical protein